MIFSVCIGTTNLHPISVTKLDTIRKSRKKGKRILSDTGLGCVEEDFEDCQTKPYCCSLCSFSTKFISAYKSHMHCSHEDKMDEEMVINCPNCSFVSNSKNMKEHIQIFHSEPRKAHVTNDISTDQVSQMQPKILQGKMLTLVQAVYFCRVCHYKDVSVYALMKHVFVLHFGILLNTYIGEVEPKLVSKNKTPLVNNAKPLINKYFCKGCKIKTITHEALIYHILDRHKEVEYQVKVKIGHISELRPTSQTAPKPLLNQVPASAPPYRRARTALCVRSLAHASSEARQLAPAAPHVELPQQALPHVEPPELALLCVEPPESALSHLESPQLAMPHVEQPESAPLHVEQPESALPYIESPQPAWSWIEPLESAPSCVDPLTPLAGSPSPPSVGPPVSLLPSVESPVKPNVELPALLLRNVRPLTPPRPSVVTLVPLAPRVTSPSSPGVTTQILAPPHVQSMPATSTIKLSLPATVQQAINVVALNHNIKPVTVGSILTNVNHFPSQNSATIRANAPGNVSSASQVLRHLIQRTNHVVNGVPTYTRLTPVQFSLPISSAGMTGGTPGMNSTVQVPMTVTQTNAITSVSDQQIKEPSPEMTFASPLVQEQQREDCVTPPKTQQWKSCSECSELVPLNLFDSHVATVHNVEQVSDKPEKVVASATYLQRVRAQIGKCLLCKRYVHKNGLLSHLLTHGLSCLFCALTFHDLAQLAEHVKSLHLGLKFESVHYIKDGVPTSSQINGGSFNMTITLPEDKMGPNDIHLTLIPNKMSSPHAPLLIEICRE
uniref:ADNP homeobox protein 2-like n=1 Tax=Callorhinchus milii TaxID=7868 RepID=A0A4W3IIQ1_CALMI